MKTGPVSIYGVIGHPRSFSTLRRLQVMAEGPQEALETVANQAGVGVSTLTVIQPDRWGRLPAES